MSTTIDQRVVEMRFDNKHFESNVSTTMSTLDKLKQKLNLNGATKGLENVDSAAKKVNMSSLGGAVEAVSTKFSALQVMGVTALANITNSAVNAGKRIISALTIDPVKTGFSEYETKINSIQTIMSNTASKGTTMSDVTRVIDELNTYADKTIYNFAEMTRNIGTFTAAGVGLEESAAAIQGIANLAASSGSTSQQASTAMYQLSQALAAGTVKLMDWNSVVNAGMGGEKFQEALKATARDHGVAVDALIEKNGSFRESLSEGWISAEILNETLNKFTTKGAKEYGKAMVETGKWTQEQADALLKEAQAMEDAATKVKTFTQLWDTLKESAQSGWGKTWELIFGDFEEAKELFTGLSDFFGGIINAMSDWRNGILESALGKSFTQLTEKLDGVFKPATKVAETLKDTVSTVKDLGGIVDDVILGKFGNGQERFDALAKAGHNYCEVQNKVNEKLGDSFRYSDAQIAAQDKLLGKQTETTEKAEKQAEATVELTKQEKIRLAQLAKLTDEELKRENLTEDQIAAIKELRTQAEKLGMEVPQLLENLNNIDGRWLLIESFKNAGKGLIEVFDAMKIAWQDVFPPKSIAERAEQLFNLLAAMYKFSTGLVGVIKKGDKLTETGDKLMRTFKGLFAVVDILATVTGGALKFGFKILTALLGKFDLNILDITANVGDALVGFRDWIDSILDVNRAVDFLVPIVENGAKALSDWFAEFKETAAVQRLVTAVEAVHSAFNKLFNGKLDITEFARKLGTNLAEALKSLPGIAIQIGKDFVAGFKEGLDFNISDLISDIVNFCLEFVAAFAEALGVESPSWKAFEIVCDFFQGAVNGAKVMIGVVVGFFKKVGEEIVKVFKSFWDYITDESGNIEWGKIFAGGIVVAMVWLLKQIATAVSGIADALGGFGDLLDNAGRVMKSFSKVLNGIAWDMKAQALQKMAIAIAILVGSLWVLSQIDGDSLIKGLGTITVLAIVLMGLSSALDKMSQASVKIGKDGANIDGIKSGLLQIGIVLLLLAATVKLIGDMNPEQANQGFIGLAKLAVGMIAFLALMGGISRYTKDVSQFGGMMLKLAIAMMLLVGVMKLVSTLTDYEMGRGVIFAAGFAVFVMAITSVAKSSGEHVSKVGGMMIKLAIAMGLMIGVMKLVNTLSPEEILKGAAFATGFVIFVKALVWAIKVGDEKEIAKVGGLILSISFSLTLLAGVCKLIGMLSIEDMIKGAAFVTGFVVLLKILLSILKIGSEQQIAKVTGTIFAISAAVALLAGVALALSLVDLGGLMKGVAAVSMLGLVMMGMIKALKGAQNVKGSIMMMAIAIGVMAAAIIALTFIEDSSKLAAAVGSLAVVMGMFALIEKCSGSVGKSVGTLAVMTIAVGALAGILYLLTNNISSADSAIKVAASLAILMGALAISLKLISNLSPTAMAGVGTLAVMTLVLGGIALILGLMSHFDVAPTIETAIALSILLLSLTGVTAALTLLGGGAPLALAGIGAFAAVVVGIGALITALGYLNEKCPELQNFLDSGIAVLEKIGEGIGRFVGGLVGAIGESLMDSLINMVDSFKIVMEKLVEASNIGADINLDGFNGVEKLLEVIGSIGSTTVGSTFTDIFTLGGTSMEKFQTDGVAFFKAMKAIAEASADVTVNEEAMDTVIIIAQKLADLQSSLEPIGGVVSWFSGRDDLGTFGVNSGIFVWAMAKAINSLDGMTMDTYAFTWIIQAAKKLAELQSSLDPIGGVVSWFSGRSDLATFGVSIGLFVTAMKLAFANLDDASFNEAAADALINVSTKLADLQTKLEPIGGVVSWFSGRDDLGRFGVNVAAFIASMVAAFSVLDDAKLDTVAFNYVIAAAQKLAELQSSLEPIGGVITWFTGRDDLGRFGINVAAFIASMKTALETLEGTTLDETALSSVISAATKLAELQSQLEPMGGVISWFAGRTDLGTFGDNVSKFAEAMGKLKEGMGENGITEAVISSITNAGTAIIELEKTLPEEHWFDGKMDLTEFSAYITNFSTAMGKFGAAASGIDTAAVSTTIDTANKIKTLIESLVGLDTSGLATFTGVGTGGFGADGAAYKIAQAMASYSNKVAGIDTSAVNTSVSAATKLKSLISGLVGLDTSGIEDFKPAPIGDSIKSYANKVKGVDAASISSSITSANRLKNLISGLVGLDNSGIGKFNVRPLGDSIKSYASSVKGFDAGSVSSSISSANRLKNFIDSLAGLDTSGVGSFTSAVKQLGTISVDEVVKSFNGASSRMLKSGAELLESVTKGMKSRQSNLTRTATTMVNSVIKAIQSKINAFTQAGRKLGDALVKGITAAKSKTTNAAKSVVSGCASAIRGQYNDFYNAGRYLVDGFAQGITDRTWYAEARARAMANAAERAAKQALDINSPSKVFRRIGYSVPEGFAQGIDRMTGMVKTSAVDMASIAINNVKSSIGRIADAINSDIDAQPTIRPVLDLSNVRAGAGAIGSLFGGASVGVMANVGAISAGMSRYGQNGSTEEVVSAINKLRKDLSNVGNTTYSINGITYDDGSNIRDAVSAIVRQARIERRV